MIIEKIIIENFRQFKDRQVLNLSPEGNKNVTVVHAENGFGKTTILKAILWALYGQDGLQDDFEKPDAILHEGLTHQSDEPDKTFASVELVFSHDDNKKYILKRTLSLRQQLNGETNKSTVELSSLTNGQTLTLDNPKSRIQSIVPNGISGFLFFNGERINFLAEEKNSNQVTQAIRQMLGLELVQTAINDLLHQNVLGQFRKEQRAYANKEKRELLESLDKLEIQKQEKENRKEQVNKNLQSIDREISEIDKKLSQSQTSQDLQEERASLTTKLEKDKNELEDIESQLCKIIAGYGFTFFSESLVQRGREILNKLRSEGTIPARVLNSFLKELLDSQNCICKRHLQLGTEERKYVEGLLTIAGDEDFNNRVEKIYHSIGVMESEEPVRRDQVNDHIKNRIRLFIEIQNTEERLKQIHEILNEKDDDAIKDLEKRRGELAKSKEKHHEENGELKEKIAAIQEEIEDLNKKISKVLEEEEEAQRVQRRIDAINASVNILKEILNTETEELRPLLNGEIDKYFRKIMTKDYSAELTDDYKLRVQKKVFSSRGDAKLTDAALSTGERTVISLVFIASLLALSKRRSEIPTILKGLSGSVFPLVIDSPFGSLSIFREGVAKIIPELAPQILLLVSPEQYNGSVEKVLNQTGRVGKRYYLSYHGPSLPEKSKPELSISGETFTQYYEVKDDEYTQIEEII